MDRSKFLGVALFITGILFIPLVGTALFINAEALDSRQAQIAFVSMRDGNSEIYVMDVDGSNQRNLTKHLGEDSSPAWSPDGQKVAFSSVRGGDENPKIYIMNADGSNVYRLTDLPGLEYSPNWSPDGRQIAFSYQSEPAESGIFVIDINGKNPKRLTFIRGDIDPNWSPDGHMIAFSSPKDGNLHSDICVIDIDGDNVSNITNNLSRNRCPDWSPDGRKILFSSDRDERGMWFEVYSMDPDGKNIRRLTNQPLSDYEAVWSPDGLWIAFTSYRGGVIPSTPWIYMMDADGDNIHRLTNNSAGDRKPAWNPQSTYSIAPASKCVTKWGQLKHTSK